VAISTIRQLRRISVDPRLAESGGSGVFLHSPVERFAASPHVSNSQQVLRSRRVATACQSAPHKPRATLCIDGSWPTRSPRGSGGSPSDVGATLLVMTPEKPSLVQFHGVTGSGRIWQDVVPLVRVSRCSHADSPRAPRRACDPAPSGARQRHGGRGRTLSGRAWSAATPSRRELAGRMGGHRVGTAWSRRERLRFLPGGLLVGQRFS
jgi:hypothetical protein